MKKPQKNICRSISAMILSFMVISSLIPANTIIVNAANTSVSDPVVVSDESMNAEQKSTFDCIWFGSYPQTEIVETESGCITYGQSFYQESDCVVDSTIYKRLKEASWDSNDDVTLEGTKYRRVKRSSVYHYFRYDPIKWRVLNVKNNKALLLADKVLDYQHFNSTISAATWETCTLRSWLNGYNAASNKSGIDYSGADNFENTAFSEDELKAVQDTTLDNASTCWTPDYGGNGTTDKVFLLAIKEVAGETGVTYGFAQYMNIDDEAKRSLSSTYAKLFEIRLDPIYPFLCSNESGLSGWILRSPGFNSNNRTSYVNASGDASEECSIDLYNGIRPSLTLDLTCDVWKNAGTVCSDGNVAEICFNHGEEEIIPGVKATCTEDGYTESAVCPQCGTVLRESKVIPHTGHFEVTEEVNPATMTGDGTTAGSDCAYCGKVFEGMEVIPQIDKAVLSFDSASYDGTAKSPEVLVYDKEGNQLTEDTDYTVTTPSGRTNAGVYKYTVKFKGNYAGSTKLTLTINPISSASNKASLSYTTAIYDGSTKSPVLKVYDSKGKLLIKNTDYTVSTPSGRKNVGAYTYTVTYTGNYEKACTKLTLTINPKGTTISKLTALTKSFKVTWKKNAAQTSGYQLQYSTSSTFKSAKTVTVSGTKTTAKTIKSLKAKTKYYVRIRTYKTVSGKKYYSAWSAKKSVKTK